MQWPFATCGQYYNSVTIVATIVIQKSQIIKFKRRKIIVIKMIQLTWITIVTRLQCWPLGEKNIWMCFSQCGYKFNSQHPLGTFRCAVYYWLFSDLVAKLIFIFGFASLHCKNIIVICQLRLFYGSFINHLLFRLVTFFTCTSFGKQFLLRR